MTSRGPAARAPHGRNALQRTPRWFHLFLHAVKVCPTCGVKQPIENFPRYGADEPCETCPAQVVMGPATLREEAA